MLPLLQRCCTTRHSSMQSVMAILPVSHSKSLMQGKVRDTYDFGDRLVIITTDRQSAFDRILAEVPFKVRCQPHRAVCVM